MRYPNLFILGAPKCGTTTMVTWLSSHPSIFVPPAKEPHYFSEEYRLTGTLEKYLGTYRDATDSHLWLLDASVWQLYSPNAVPNILRSTSEPRFVVMLRNPLEMAPSMHAQQTFNGNELIQDFTEALRLSDSRTAGSRSGVIDGYPSDHLAYLHSCATGWQLERLLSWVPRNKVHIIFMEDLRQAPQKTLASVYDFLDLDAVYPADFRAINAAKVRRYPSLDRIVKRLGDWKARSGVGIRLGILAKLRKWNRKNQTVAPVPVETLLQMREAFREDVALLSRLTGRDLSHWLN